MEEKLVYKDKSQMDFVDKNTSLIFKWVTTALTSELRVVRVSTIETFLKVSNANTLVPNAHQERPIKHTKWHFLFNMLSA